MRDFLTDYVLMIVENHETEITQDKLNSIVEYLMEDEEVWNLVDSIIIEKLERRD